ncbi:MAG TPA: DUF1566 domain-containing protein [Candidatus Dormibacteraeota bacterium]|nr:DUF1566 domain-containing protein [Candidatus Dormibacteraeota bacterium]
MTRQWRVIGALAVVVGAMLLAGSAAAVTPAEKCEAAKIKLAGKYNLCRLKAEAKAIKNGDPLDFVKCDDKYSLKWQLAENQAGIGVCPSEGDEAAIQGFITQHTDDLAAALAGGPLPDCPGDLASCTGDLATCNGILGTCSGNLSICTGDLSTCNGDLTTCSAGLGTCNGTLTACASGLATCSSDLATAQNDLATCTSSQMACSATLLLVNLGTAAQADVRSGKVFSSSAGINVFGTMADNGAVNITPGTSAQAIAAGYHNGGGSVAGDADLAAGNIKNGVDVFGVTGTLSAGAVPKTGQMQSYGPGSDGDLQKGASRSFTDNGDGTITDNTTGLMWEKKSNDGSIHDKDNSYTWGLFIYPYTMNGTMVTTFLAALNGGAGFAGHTDWRIPNVNELLSLVNYSHFDPAVDWEFANTPYPGCSPGCTVTTCSCTISNYYWSSTTRQIPFTDAYALNVDFWAGYLAEDFMKDTAHYVRAVRGGS